MKLPDGLHKDCPAAIIPHESEVNRTVNCQFWKVTPAIWIGIANIAPLLIIVPLFDRLIYPSLARHSPPMLARIGVGKLFLLASIIIAIGIESFRNNELGDHILADNGTKSLVLNAIPFHTGSSTTLHVASPVSIALIIPQYLLFAFAEVLSNVTGQHSLILNAW